MAFNRRGKTKNYYYKPSRTEVHGSNGNTYPYGQYEYEYEYKHQTEKRTSSGYIKPYQQPPRFGGYHVRKQKGTVKKVVVEDIESAVPEVN